MKRLYAFKGCVAKGFGISEKLRLETAGTKQSFEKDARNTQK